MNARCWIAAAALLSACGQGRDPAARWFAETEPAPSTEDAADDPAIWTHPTQPERSLVLGTDKQTGLYVYNLSGALVQSLPVGPLNNVDLRQGVWNGRDIAVATHDGLNVIKVFEIDRDSGLVAEIAEFPAGRNEPYGVCLGEIGGRLTAVVTYKDGAMDFHALDETGAAALVRTVRLASQLEGCVVDETHRRLFVGEELVGVWTLDLTTDESLPAPIDSVGGASGLAADVEGVTLWRGEDDCCLVVSAQGANRFVVYERLPPFRPLGRFRVEGPGDNVTGTDGIDISSAGFGAAAPRGLLVVQDDVNTAPSANQNFKLIDWREVERATASKE